MLPQQIRPVDDQIADAALPRQPDRAVPLIGAHYRRTGDALEHAVAAHFPETARY
ncbi:hypothetical protein [Roseicitreum antarcticum]|uniref:Uncharacterized protein n=1 Tax=Roseicitreum antarcticum TaxID=564137 RepID=A0A1H2TBM2_9RHOB|nr:hypothetical protein [Roseicitreum antarcticum]SDW41220.1 hypothetical protein SAMN04488238_1024 [Roseicitreum antarcticum]